MREAGAEAVYADGKEWGFGGTQIVASPSLWHGPAGSKTGRVVAFAVRDGEETLAFVPDVEGPVEPEPVAFLRQVRPTIAVVGGPPTYLSWELEKALKHLAEIIALEPHTLVLAHHLLRDAQWRDKMSSVFELAERHGVAVTTYAGLAGRPEELLEARRRELYEKEPAEPKPQGEEEED